jgi:hypothetical protein
MARGVKGSGKPKEEKDPWDLLDKNEKTAFEHSSDEELNKRIADVAKNDAALTEVMKQDLELARAKQAVKTAMEPYRTGHKANRQRIAYARFLLESRGKDAGDSGLPERTGATVDDIKEFAQGLRDAGVTSFKVKVGDSAKIDAALAAGAE